MEKGKKVIASEREDQLSKYKNYIDSLNKSLEWKLTSFGLWKANTGVVIDCKKKSLENEYSCDIQ